MTGLLVLIAKYAMRTPVQTGVVSISIAVAIALPVAGRVITERYEQRLGDRAAAIPLVVGAPGSRFDLAMATLFYRGEPAAPLPLASIDALRAEDRGAVVPLRLIGSSNGAPIVAVGLEFFELRDLAVAAGDLPFRLADAVLGSAVAAEIGLDVGDTITTDRRELFDLSVPTPVDLRVVGVLEPTGEADDRAVFVDIETAWIIAGVSHAHREGASAEPGDVSMEAEGRVVLRQTLETVTAVTDDNVDAFHLHADRTTLPITAALVFPESAKDRTILSTSVNARGDRLAIEPAELVDELFAAVFRVRPVFDAIAAVLGLSTLCLVVLSSMLAARLRVAEFAALDHMGAPRWFVLGLIVGQSVVVIALGSVLAAALVGGALVALHGILGV